MARRLVALAPVLVVVAGCGGAEQVSPRTQAPVPVAPAAGTAAADAAIVTPPAYVVAKWHPNTSNVYVAVGRVALGGRPVAHARVKVDDFTIPSPTSTDGSFRYEADANAPVRHKVAIVDASRATIDGVPLTAAQRSTLLRARGAITVAYAIRDLKVSRGKGGTVGVTGRLAFGDGTAPNAVVLYSYRLSGRVTDDKGRPVVGARVSTRTLDRDFWTISTPTDANGEFESLFTASSERRVDPVPFTVRVARGDRVYEFLPDENVLFKRLQSARLDLELPPGGYPMGLPQPVSYPGAVYDGVLVGAAVGGRPVRPLAATWPDASGRFRLVLPAAVRGETLSLWQSRLQVFSRTAAGPGRPVDLSGWPATLAPNVPRGVATVRAPS